MTVDVFHEGGGCEEITKVKGFLKASVQTEYWLCKNKPTHVAVLKDGTEKKVCDKHAEEWLDLGVAVDLVPL